MDELEAFKTNINLNEYAADQGHELDRRESSRNSVIMRHFTQNGGLQILFLKCSGKTKKIQKIGSRKTRSGESLSLSLSVFNSMFATLSQESLCHNRLVPL